MTDSDNLRKLEAECARLLRMIAWENRDPLEPVGSRALVIAALLPILIPVAALVVASLISNEISLMRLIQGVALTGLILLVMIALFAVGRTAGEPTSSTIGLLTTLTCGISFVEPPGAKNGEVEVRQRLEDCEDQITALKKNAQWRST